MNKKEIMWETFNTINKAVTTYKCKRNQDLGLRNPSVEKKLDAFTIALYKQFDKINKTK